MNVNPHDERRCWVALLTHIKAEDAVAFLSRRMPLSLDLLERYKDRWDWEVLSNNESMPWSLDLLGSFEDSWTWWDLDEPIGLSNNDSLPWSLELLERFKDRWDWGCLSNNNTLPWSLELLEHFEDKWAWERRDIWDDGEDAWNPVNCGLSESRFLPWSIELLERFEGHWNWERLSANESLPWSIELLARFKDRWDWSKLSQHQFLPWADLLKLFDATNYYLGRQIPESYWQQWLGGPNPPRRLLEQYKDQWEWSICPESEMHDDFLEYSGLGESEWLEWFEHYEDKWDWVELSQITSLVFESDSLPWSISLLQSYEDREELETNLLLGISLSETASWSMELLERIDEHFDVERYCKELYLSEDSWKAERFSKAQEKIWKRLSLNKSLPWSKELTERFTYLWNSWEQQPVVWSTEKLEHIEEDWDWDRKYDQYREQMWDLGYSVEQKDCWIWKRLSWEESLPWSIELLEHFEERWDWSNLSWNKSLPWSVELIERFSDRWNWEALSQNTSLPKLPLTTQDVDNIMKNIVAVE